MSISIYRALTWISAPLIRSYLDRRREDGKEDPERFDERHGLASRARPEGPLVWIHAASVGESLSMISLIDRLRKERPEITILITSGTVSSARLLGERLSEDVIHQYIPVDRVPWVRRFLDYWRPDLTLWVESEFWPAVLSEVRARRIPAFLMNARISASSLRGWRRAPWMIRLNTSRPIMSAPKIIDPSGAFREWLALVCSGSCGATTSAKIADMTKTNTITAPIAPSGCR